MNNMQKSEGNMSKRNTLKTLTVISILLVVSLACNAPSSLGGEVTPDLTLTAIFAPISGTQTAQAAGVVGTEAPASGNPTPQLPMATTTFRPTGTLLPSATAALTNTPVSITLTPYTANTNTVASASRPGPQFFVPYINPAPVMDGDWGDWKARTTERPCEILIFGSGAWSGADDLQASYIVGWDSTYLFLGFKVRDTVYAQNASGANIFQGDSIDILIDTNYLGDLNSTAMSIDDYQLGISPGNPSTSGTRSAFLWQPAGIAGDRSSQIVVASVGGDGIYRVEVAIPWSMLGVTPSSGLQLGFLVSVSDNDDRSANVQESMVSAYRGRSISNPTTWGAITLTR
ncbi:MAG TPA: sugar-binding protein [Longilinea sp.]|nr:sugar-binding protein [Longilinea sp.]